MRYSVIVEQNNGSWRAVIPILAGLSAEGASLEDALRNAQQVAESYLANVVVTTIEIGTPHLGTPGRQNDGGPRYREAVERELAIAAELSLPDADSRLGSLQSLVRAAADCRINTASEMFKEYEAEMDAEKARQLAEAECEADAAAV